jgi:hypothetical protein
MAPNKSKKTAAIAAVAKQTEKLQKAADEAKAAETKPKKGNSKKAVVETETATEPAAEPEKPKKNGSKKAVAAAETKADDKATKEKRPPTEYQKFVTAKLAELREEYDDEETRPGYRDLMKMVVEAWRTENPQKEKKPAAKKKAKSDDEDGTEKKKRAPSAYNIFIKHIMPQIKAEHENDDPKLNQKDIMKLAAEKWNEHKTTLAAVTA